MSKNEIKIRFIGKIFDIKLPIINSSPKKLDTLVGIKILPVIFLPK